MKFLPKNALGFTIFFLGLMPFEARSEAPLPTLWISINKIKQSDGKSVALETSEVATLLHRLNAKIPVSKDCQFEAHISNITTVGGLNIDDLGGPYDTRDPFYHASVFIEQKNTCANKAAKLYYDFLRDLHDKEVIYFMSSPPVDPSPSVSGRN